MSTGQNLFASTSLCCCILQRLQKPSQILGCMDSRQVCHRSLCSCILQRLQKPSQILGCMDSHQACHRSLWADFSNPATLERLPWNLFRSTISSFSSTWRTCVIRPPGADRLCMTWPGFSERCCLSQQQNGLLWIHFEGSERSNILGPVVLFNQALQCLFVCGCTKTNIESFCKVWRISTPVDSDTIQLSKSPYCSSSRTSL